MSDIADIAREVREGAGLAPRLRRPIAGFAKLASPRPRPDPRARPLDRRGRALEPGDPLLFAAAGPFLGVYLGRYVGRDPETGRMIAEIDPGEPRAGERAFVQPGLSIRFRGEDQVAELRAGITREITRLGGDAL